jgi:hypothetical protein
MIVVAQVTIAAAKRQQRIFAATEIENTRSAAELCHRAVAL